MNNKEAPRLKRSTMLAFAMGDFYAGGCYNVIAFFYLYFLTSVAGINPLRAGAIMAIGKVWDAITDPFMGMLSDRTHSRFGRRRPYFLYGVPLIILSFSAMWFPFSAGGEWGKTIFYTIAFMFCYTVSTMVQVPFIAMRAELTSDYNERNTLSAIEMAVSLFSTMVCAMLPYYIYSMFDDLRTGYFVMGVVFSLFFALPLLITFFRVKEPEGRPAPERTSVKDMWKEMFSTLKVKTFRLYNWMYLGVYIAMAVVSSVFIYFTQDYLGRTDGTIVLGVLILAEICFIPLANSMCSRRGKGQAIAFGCALFCLFSLSTLLVHPASATFLIYLIGAAMGAAFSFAVVGSISSFGEATDAYELFSGKRAEGTLSGVNQLLYKLCSAIASLLIGWILKMTGYIEGLAPGLRQPESALNGVRGIIAVSPFLLLIPALFAALRFPLTKERHALLSPLLAKRRSGEPLDLSEESTLAEMKEVL